MSQFPTREQQEAAERTLHAVGSLSKAHKKEIDALTTRIAELEAENAALRTTPTYPDHMLGKPVTTSESWYNMNMKEAPLGGKLIALNPGKVAAFATITNSNRNDFIGWSPMPKIPKDKP